MMFEHEKGLEHEKNLALRKQMEAAKFSNNPIGFWEHMCFIQGELVRRPVSVPCPFCGVNDSPRSTVDNVNSPAHYASGAVECIDAIEAQLTPEEFRGYLKGNIAKYVWREKTKGGVESLKKAQWYLNRLVK